MQRSSIELVSLDLVKCTIFPFVTIISDCECIRFVSCMLSNLFIRK